MTQKNRKYTEKTRKKMFLLVTVLGFLLVVNLLFSLFYFGFLKLPGFEKENDFFYEDIKETVYEIDEEITEIEILSLDGFVEIDVELSEDFNFILLINKEDKCDGMIVAIDPSQAFSIHQGMDSQVSFRPTSHDTARDILEQYDIKVIMAKVVDLRGGAYFGRLVLDDGNKIVNLDVRPSDGIAIAVRTNSPIYLSKSLLSDFGEKIC